MKLTIRNDEDVAVTLHTKPGEVQVLEPKGELAVDADVMLVHGPEDHWRAQHGFCDAVGVPSHSSTGAPHAMAIRMALGLSKATKAVKGE